MARSTVNSEMAPKALGPYSQAIRIGDFLFTSGQVPIDPATGKVVEGGITAQTHRVFANLRAVLEAGGTSFANVVKATVFLRDMNDFQALNAAYAEYLGECKPARSTVQVARLPLDVAVEIELVAWCGA